MTHGDGRIGFGMIAIQQQTRRLSSLAIFLGVILNISGYGCAFQPLKAGGATTIRQRSHQPNKSLVIMGGATNNLDESRRVFLSGAVFGSVSLLSSGVLASDGDMTSTMFNEDGSLKEGVQMVGAAERTIEFGWDSSDGLKVNSDGVNLDGTESGSAYKVSYRLPEKWGTGDMLYADSSLGLNEKACNRVIVYQALGRVSESQLEKATSIGVGKALRVIKELGAINRSDIIGGRKVEKQGGETYYEFEVATAPETCGTSQENLGLGFCPYDTIYLLSAIIDEYDRLFVLGVECSNDEWKFASADLKRVRSSFAVKRTYS